MLNYDILIHVDFIFIIIHQILLKIILYPVMISKDKMTAVL